MYEIPSHILLLTIIINIVLYSLVHIGLFIMSINSAKRLQKSLEEIENSRNKFMADIMYQECLDKQ